MTSQLFDLSLGKKSLKKPQELTPFSIQENVTDLEP